jgi:hypothetical protein
MNTAILTYPGHAFSTYLTVRSVREHISNDPITLIIDDFFLDGWPSFIQDITKLIPDVNIRRFSELQGGILATVGRGWIRQQLIKLNIDRYFDGDVFVVDGDVIFDAHVDLSVVPLHKLAMINKLDHSFDDYVKTVLNVNKGHFEVDGVWCQTSSTPFRLLEDGLLKSLRHHVEQLHNTKFTEFHMTLPEVSEWELIEIYRQTTKYRKPEELVGSGNHTFDNTVTNPGFKYRHSSMKDDEIGIGWFHYNGVPITNELWEKSQTWHRKLIR